MNKNKGFAAMTVEQKREIASAGGKAAHAKGSAYKFNTLTAKEAGKKGGKTVSQNKEHMSIIGQKGGQARSRNMGINKVNELTTRYDAMQA